MQAAFKYSDMQNDFFINQVAEDMGIKHKISHEDCARAHKFAKDGASEDYYYRLKEFFLN